MSDHLKNRLSDLNQKLADIEAGKLTFTDDGKKMISIQRTKRFIAETESALKAVSKEAKK